MEKRCETGLEYVQYAARWVKMNGQTFETEQLQIRLAEDKLG